MMLWWRNFDIKITPERLAGRAAGEPASHPLAAFGTLQFDALEVIICAARRAAQIWRSLCVRVCHYVKGIT